MGAGLLDAHCESLAPWDVAAAALIATEAGARRGNLVPEPFPFAGDLAGTGFVVAAPTIYAQLFELLSGPPGESEQLVPNQGRLAMVLSRCRERRRR